MGFNNTEMSVSISGVTGSFIKDIYPESHTHSGAGVVNVVSGAGVLGGVIPFLHSGGASDAASGSVIRVTDAISGVVTLVTKVLYNHDFGAFSGLTADASGARGVIGLDYRAPPMAHLGAVFLSGLNIQGAADYGVTVYYKKPTT